ncbi:hypothetical protein [Amycolatopsis pigmentata]|uniref:Uncharacterized protein n=1 Tax=Amycolatopsis pigmentata TaxID=450801 RepID=A0ABW5FM53_9PSEU
MRIRVLATVLAAGAALVASGVITGATAEAKGRPCGDAVSTQGVGTAGTTWTLKSMYDDNGPGLVAGEEFQIETHEAGQHWTVVLSDNGVPFFTNNDDVSVASGINETHPNHVRHGTTNVMSAHAVRHETGEVIDGSVSLPVAPAQCAPNSP